MPQPMDVVYEQFLELQNRNANHKNVLQRAVQALLVEAQENFRITLQNRLTAQKLYQDLLPRGGGGCVWTSCISGFGSLGFCSLRSVPFS
jgi:hypothetical protein